MRRSTWVTLAVLAVALVVLALPSQTPAQQKKIVMWTHWDQNPEFNKWYATKGKDFAAKSGFDV